MSVSGSARASRAGDGALAIANFSELANDLSRHRKIDYGEAPQSAREARALPGKNGQLSKLLVGCCICTLLSCETTNYAPPVTPQMAADSSRRADIDPVKLREGRTLFVRRCIECHTLPAIWKYSREDWPKIVNDMSHRASLKPAEREAVIAYILAVRKAM